MAFVPLARISHTLIVSGVPTPARSATLTLRINRSDGFVYDWDDDTFKAAGTATTPAQTATELDATNDEGFYYWEIGTPGGSVNHVLSTAFSVDGPYRFEVRDSGITYAYSWSAEIENRRPAAQSAVEQVACKKALSEAGSNNLILYERDDATAMKTKTVLDKSGGVITLAAGIPAQESS